VVWRRQGCTCSSQISSVSFTRISLTIPSPLLRLDGSGYCVEGSGYCVELQDTGFRVEGSGFRVEEFEVQGIGTMVQA
jgi:hypothetical protein